MYSLSVLQVVDPSCFFCEILKESDSKEYEQLFMELNFLYSTVYRDVEELKPVSLPVGTFCIVFYEKTKSWCRAILESTTCSAQDELVDCFLLDYALYCPIKKTKIRYPVEECKKLPVRAKKFKLHQIQPISLCIDVSENKSELRLAKSWDTSAIHYFQQLLNESLKIEAQICSVENNCTGVNLYLTTTTDSVICANDDLVAKKYACYENGNPEDKMKNGKVTFSPAKILQNGDTSISLAEEQSLEMQKPGVVSIRGPTLWRDSNSPNQPIDVAEKIAADTREAVVLRIKERRAADSQNEKPLLSLSEEQPRSASESVVVASPQRKESQQFPNSPEFKAVTSPDPFIRPAWCKADQGQRLHAEAAEKPAADIRDTAVQPSNAMSLQRQEENASNSVSKEHHSCVFETAGASSPKDPEFNSSSLSTFKIVTGPDPFLRPVFSKTDPEQRLRAEVAENTLAEIRKCAQTQIGMTSSPDNSPIRVNNEKPIQAVQEKLQTAESDTGVASDPAQFVWPAWSNRDHRRRLSTEITEKSFAKLSAIGGSKSVRTKEVDNKPGLVRLLQFLNPTPYHLPEEESRKPPNVTKPQHAMFVSKTLAPYLTLEETSLCTDIKKRLMMNGYNKPNLTESYCWAPIAEGFDTIVISPDGSNPLYYIPPLLTYLSCASIAYKLISARHGPHAVILCPGWDKAHSVYNLLMDFSRYARPLSPNLLLVGRKKEEIERINFRKPCEVIVTTPHILLRCLEHDGLLLLRLCHLVFDEVDVLFSKAGSEMSEILRIYKKIVTAESRDGTPQQIVAVGSKWIRDMQLLRQYTSTPQVVIARMEQAAVFANVQQVIQLCLDCEKLSVLLQCLDFTPVDVQKILIFTKNDEEAELVHKAVQTASVYCLLLHKSLVHKFGHVLEQWKKVISRGTVVLVVTDDYAPLLEVTDATCVIHYSFPENVGVLSLRLLSLLDYIQCKIDKVSMEEDDHSRAKSVLLMTEKHASCAIDLLKSLQQAQASVPPELVALAQGLLQALEKNKREQEICPYLKTLGYCNQDEYACPHRHHINPSQDLCDGFATIPDSDQYITVLPLCIVNAARFFGRVVTKNDPYDKLAAELNEYYQSPINKILARTVECKHLYAISDGTEYHRVQVLSTKTVDSVSVAHVQYVDDGKTEEISVHMIFLLPPAFQSIPPQCREFLVCRVKPIDNEEMWDPKVTRIITRSIRGKKHTAKVVLKLGKTFWLDPMVQVTTLPGLSSCVYDFNVRQEILSTGLGTDNPQHVIQLKALLEGRESSQVSADRDENEKAQVPEKSPDDNSISTAPCLEKANSGSGNKVVSASLLPQSDDEREQPEEVAAHGDSEPRDNLQPTSLYPEVKWFEKDDAVILTVKLRQVADPKCTFYSDRVVFSCDAGGKHYVADLELCKDIVREKSECSFKSGEAVITIQKSKVEMWNKLLKHKHPNVTFDFDHLQDEDSEAMMTDVSAADTMCFYNVISEDQVSLENSESESD
ncbi:putative ATP-dependent RNA helicase TDRD12 [Rhinoderma darwinii]|uniref:putative ATP-dependent RNA helicase TDRD12 n=1 Tax=Rhinoderma darwinii TaxID=43563 RepID=UPI003F6740EE